MDFQKTTANIHQYYFRPPVGKPVIIAYDTEKKELVRKLAAELEKAGNPTVLALMEGDSTTIHSAFQRILENDGIALAVFASHTMWKELYLEKLLDFRNHQPSLRGKPDPLFFDAAIPLENLDRLYGADPASIRSYTEGLKRHLPDHQQVRLTTHAGTNLTFTSRQWKVWGWEVMTCPVEGSIEGKIIVDGATFFELVNHPIELNISGGRLVGMNCGGTSDPVFRQYRQWMMEAFEADPANSQLCEVGLGANPGAQLTSVVMESEAVQGTVHVCFGDNAQFAGMDGQNHTGWHGGTIILRNPKLKSQ